MFDGLKVRRNKWMQQCLPKERQRNEKICCLDWDAEEQTGKFTHASTFISFRKVPSLNTLFFIFFTFWLHFHFFLVILLSFKTTKILNKIKIMSFIIKLSFIFFLTHYRMYL